MELVIMYGAKQYLQMLLYDLQHSNIHNGTRIRCKSAP